MTNLKKGQESLYNIKILLKKFLLQENILYMIQNPIGLLSTPPVCRPCVYVCIRISMGYLLWLMDIFVILKAASLSLKFCPVRFFDVGAGVF